MSITNPTQEEFSGAELMVTVDPATVHVSATNPTLAGLEIPRISRFFNGLVDPVGLGPFRNRKTSARSASPVLGNAIMPDN